MRWLIGIALLGAIFYWVNHRVPEPSYTGIANYNEVRIGIKAGSREIELVSYLKRDSSEPCQESDRWFMDATLRCEDSGQCEVKQRACMNGLPDRYLPMFNQQRDTTAYLYVEQPTRYRSGVMLFWGLNEQESIQLCQSMLNQVLANKKAHKLSEDVIARCIHPE